MWVAFLLLGLFVGGVAAAVAFAMTRGVWLKVEIDQRVMHHHHVHAGAVYPESTAYALDDRVFASSVLSRAVLPRRSTRPAHYIATRRELEP